MEILILVLNFKVIKKYFMYVYFKKSKKKVMIFFGGINKIFIYFLYDYGINVKIIWIYVFCKFSNCEV